MADIKTALVAHLAADAAVAAIVAARIYPRTLPQGCTLPAIRFKRVSGVKDRVAAIVDSRWQFDCVAGTDIVAANLAAAVTAALHRYSGTVSGTELLWGNQEDEYDLDVTQNTHEYVSSVDVRIVYRE